MSEAVYLTFPHSLSPRKSDWYAKLRATHLLTLLCHNDSDRVAFMARKGYLRKLLEWTGLARDLRDLTVDVKTPPFYRPPTLDLKTAQRQDAKKEMEGKPTPQNAAAPAKGSAMASFRAAANFIIAYFAPSSPSTPIGLTYGRRDPEMLDL